MESLDPHQRPPDGIRDVYKKYQKMKLEDLNQDPDILDLDNDLLMSNPQKRKISIVTELGPEHLRTVFQDFTEMNELGSELQPVKVYEHSDMPGLHILPNLLPPSVQTKLLTLLLHRDLSNPTHLTNIHTHYTLTYPPPSPTSPNPSFFTHSPSFSIPIAKPLDPTIHNPLLIQSLLKKKLRWLTLGGQYDWTLKRYPNTPPPPFPADIAKLLTSIFPAMVPEAAILNLYSPGDTLSVHRDVAEACARDLVSVSFGCDGVFVIGTDVAGEGEKVVTLRLRSGSAVVMAAQSRFAWHGVPRIIAGTCPSEVAEWPAGEVSGEFEEWRGWMAGKRVNLNVRQMGA